LLLFYGNLWRHRQWGKSRHRFEDRAIRIDDPNRIGVFYRDKRFDLIFILQDKPDERRDANIAGHILKSHYAGELGAHRTHNASSFVTDVAVKEAQTPIMPEIDAVLLRKYIAYAKRNVYPVMTDEARERITKF